jgi:hypothetical protein
MKLKAYNVFFNLYYISDDDYYKYIKSARYVILPYLQGTNSGIISTVLSLGANIIVSDIIMFRSNPLVDKKDMFESNNPQSLLNILEKKFLEPPNFDGFEKIQNYKNDFKVKVVQVYDSIINISMV